jgi:hypothetical protein
MKSYIHFQGKMGFFFNKKGSARLTIGSHPRVQPLKDLEIASEPLFAGFIPESIGLLDDYFESWFLSYPQPPTSMPEGMESVVNLGLGQKWMPPPIATK